MRVLVLFFSFWPLVSQAKIERAFRVPVGNERALFEAAAQGNFELVKNLFASGVDPKVKWYHERESDDDMGFSTPFHHAVMNGHDSLAAYILWKANGINGRDEKSWSPLMWAIVADDWDLVKDFLEYGANVIRGGASWENSPWGIAGLMDSRGRLVEAIIEVRGINKELDWFGRTLLTCAVKDELIDDIDWLLDLGANLDQCSEHGCSAVLEAVKLRKNGVLEALLERGADPDVRDGAGRTGLHVAMMYHAREAAELLIRYGADVGAVSDSGQTPLDFANIWGSDFRSLLEGN